MTFAEFIKAKGTKAFADKMGVRHATARMWITRNHISRQLWPDLLLVYPEVGMSDLLAMEAASASDT